MGLSNEERISKFFWTANGWRKALSGLAQKCGDERVNWYTDERAGAVVERWVGEIDTLVGLVHLKTANGGSAFWLLGEGDSSLRGLLSEPYHLRQEAEPDSYMVLGDPAHETVRWWADEADHAFTASRLQFPPFKSHAGLDKLALWWDAYGYMSGLSYPLNRYDDKVFPVEVHARFTALCGEIINRRFEVCFGASDHTRGYRTEQFLLAKHNVFHALLDEEAKQRQANDFRRPKSGVSGRSVPGDSYSKKEFDGYALYERVAKMSVKEMHDLFEKQAEKKRAWDRKYHDGERAKEAAKGPKPDGLFGPPLTKEPETPAAAPAPKAKRKR